MERDYRTRLAQAWIPYQVYTTRWDPTEGLQKGTIFPELYWPYEVTESR